jgi:exopolysaccharide biosynthesis polyprenyl glycosylphosphotransferase
MATGLVTHEPLRFGSHRRAGSALDRLVIPFVGLTLVGLDTLALVAAFGIAFLARFKAGFPLLETPEYSGAFYSWIAFWAIPVWILLFAIYRLYEQHELFAGINEYVRVVNASTAGLVSIVLISFLDSRLLISRGWLVLSWALAIVLVTSVRFGMRRVVRSLRRRGVLVTPTVIVGANEEGIALAEQLLSDAAAGARLVGFVDPSLPPGSAVAHGLHVIGDFWQIDELVRRSGVRQVLVAASALSRDQLLDLFWNYGNTPQLDLRLSSGLYEILTTGVSVQHIGSIPTVTPRRTRITGLDAVLKAAIDYLLAVVLLVALSPVMLAVAIVVRLDSPGPILHRRRVLGVTGKSFDAFKFRTMIVNAERRHTQRSIDFPDRRLSFKAKEDPRITSIGRFLRRTSLDELPQLLNVLRGEMSLVGPRMIAPNEAARYGKFQRNLVTVKPGITGPWQVEGRSDLPYEQRVRLSMDYIRNYTFWTDIAILLRTVVVVLRGRGAY